jgi:hypothetical protein
VLVAAAGVVVVVEAEVMLLFVTAADVLPGCLALTVDIPAADFTNVAY